MSNLKAISARQLAKTSGLIISLYPVVGNVTRLMTRYIYSVINESSFWDNSIDISNNSSAVQELNFWLENIDSLNLNKCLCKIAKPTEVIGFSDASNIAGGGYIVHKDDKICHKMWTDVEKEQSSTWRELKAVWLALASFIGDVSNKHVKWFTDNQNVCRIINNGSKKLDLHKLTLDIYRLCLIFGIDLNIEWIPRSQNDQADYISRIQDFDDWEIQEHFFNYLSNLFGPFSVDRFADYENKKCDRFNSRFWNPGCEAVDAFTQNWKNDNNYLVPPVQLIPRTIKHLEFCKGKGFLIVPEWRSAIFWPLLVNSNNQFKKGIVDVFSFKNNGNIFKKGKNNSTFGSCRMSNNVLVINLDFTFL